jgi:hypothetical protein
LRGDVGGVEIRAEDRRVLLDRLAGNAAHDVNAELQPLGVRVIRQRLESLSIGPFFSD